MTPEEAKQLTELLAKYEKDDAGARKSALPPGEQNSSLEMKNLAREFKLADIKASGVFSGYASTFGNVDDGDDICDPKCFDRTVAEHKSAGTMPAMFFSHDMKEPVGEWTEMSIDKKGLYVEGDLWIGKGIPKAEQTYMMLKSKTQKGLSIGYQTKDSKRNASKGTRTLLDLELKEISPTPFPMNTRAKITGIKTLLLGKSIITIREAEDILRDAGFTATDTKHFISCLKSGIHAERDASEEIKQALASLNSSLSTKG